MHDKIKQLDETVGTLLPLEYRTLLLLNCGVWKVIRKSRRWKFASLTDLLRPVMVAKHSQPYVLQLKVFASLVAKMVRGNIIVDDQGNEFSLRRLACGVVIADENADLLFLDPSDNFSVWCFFHDGSDVEKQADSLYEWLAGSKVEAANVSPAQSAVIAEYWDISISDGIAHYITDVLIPRGDLPPERFLAKFGTQQVIAKGERVIINELAKKIAEFHSLSPETDVAERNAILEYIRNRWVC